MGLGVWLGTRSGDGGILILYDGFTGFFGIYIEKVISYRHIGMLRDCLSLILPDATATVDQEIPAELGLQLGEADLPADRGPVDGHVEETATPDLGPLPTLVGEEEDQHTDQRVEY